MNFFVSEYDGARAENGDTSDLTEHSYIAWSKLFAWDLYKSDLVLRVDHVLTEPTCPSVHLVHEATDIILFSCASDTIQGGILDVVSKFVAAAEAGTLPTPEEIKKRYEAKKSRERR